MSVKTSFGRRAVCLIVALGGLGALGVSGASAATFPEKTTKGLEEAVSKANANGEANTIVLAGGIDYLPAKTLKFTNTGGVQTVEGPTGSPTVIGETAVLGGGSVEPPFSELFVIAEKVSVTFKDVVINHGGGHGNPSIDDSGTLDIESSLVAGNSGAGIHVEPKAVESTFTPSATLTNSTLSDGS